MLNKSLLVCGSSGSASARRGKGRPWGSGADCRAGRAGPRRISARIPSQGKCGRSALSAPERGWNFCRDGKKSLRAWRGEHRLRPLPLSSTAALPFLPRPVSLYAAQERFKSETRSALFRGRITAAPRRARCVTGHSARERSQRRRGSALGEGLLCAPRNRPDGAAVRRGCPGRSCWVAVGAGRAGTGRAGRPLVPVT